MQSICRSSGTTDALHSSVSCWIYADLFVLMWDLPVSTCNAWWRLCQVLFPRMETAWCSDEGGHLPSHHKLEPAAGRCVLLGDWAVATELVLPTPQLSDQETLSGCAKEGLALKSHMCSHSWGQLLFTRHRLRKLHDLSANRNCQSRTLAKHIPQWLCTHTEKFEFKQNWLSGFCGSDSCKYIRLVPMLPWECCKRELCCGRWAVFAPDMAKVSRLPLGTQGSPVPEDSLSGRI